jgi:H2-forming N5,N10-methylenetetrahydromethanopterin dehydrogenase-like enzyme
MDSVAQGAMWKQIVILKSSRLDVERFLGRSNSPGFDGVYDLEEGHLFVMYTPFNFCENGRTIGWNVREDTVIEISFTPNHVPLFSSLKLELEKFKAVQESPCCPDIISYVNEEEGVAYVVNPDGTLNQVRYFPSSQHDRLLCGKQQRVTP